MKKKLLFVMPTLDTGGAERSLVNLLQELDYTVYSADLLLLKVRGEFLKQIPSEVHLLETPPEIQAFFTPERVKGFYVHKFLRILGTALGNLFTGTIRERAAFRWKYFYSRFIRNIPEVYDAAIAYLNGECLYLIDEKVTASKKIAWIHNDYRADGNSERYERPYFSRMDAIVSVSERCVEILKETFPENREKIHLIPNITSSRVIKKMADMYYPAEYEGKDFILLTVGRLVHQKGIDLAVEAARVLKNRGISFYWFFIGDGELKKEISDMIIRYDLQEQVFLLGIRSNPYPYVKNCDVFVQTSRFEGKSVVLDEAKILSVPLVVTRYPTAHEQIRSNGEGILVEMNPEAIAEGIIQMCDESARMLCTSFSREHDYGNEIEISRFYELL